MHISYGDKGTSLIECINPYTNKYRVRWDMQDVTIGEGERQQTMVCFAEEEFLHKPTPSEIEASISESGVDVSKEELNEMATLLGYTEDDFKKLWNDGRKKRIAANPYAQVLEIIKANRLKETEVTDEEALSYPSTFPTFYELAEKKEQIEKGVILRHLNKMWRSVKAHTPSLIYPPSKDTASLYTKIDVAHKGTLEDPIPYEQMMAFEKGKYYEQYGVIYLCILTTETGYPSDLKDLHTIVTKVD